MSTLLEKLAAKKKIVTDSNIWNPERQDLLEGKVLKIGSTITVNGDTPFAEVEQEGGKVLTVFLSQVLQKQFAGEGVEEGDTIAIEYIGMEKGKKSKRPYKNYVVVKADTNEEDQPE